MHASQTLQNLYRDPDRICEHGAVLGCALVLLETVAIAGSVRILRRGRRAVLRARSA